jgi:hypothetical protein
MSTESTGAKQKGRFQPGQSGNPAGRPKGARHKATMAAQTLLDGEANALTRKAIEMAKSGDPVALRLCLERILPPRKDRPVSFDLAKIERPDDASKALASILASVAAGELTPQEGAAITALIESFIRALETTELERRIAELEARNETL